jgi:hypothetical protein
MPGTQRSAPERRLLDWVEFPTDRDDLLEHAQQVDAPESVLDAIRRLRPGTIWSRQDLVAAIEAIASP